jgi:RNA polymerase sigma factor (sigma-70 family)
MATTTLATSTAAAPRPVAEASDSDLVAAVRAGDDSAFADLYARYHRRICAYVVRMVKDHARAEDVTQDVFLSALRRMRETDRPIAVKPWLYEIAKNACIDHFRRARRAELVSYDAEGGVGDADAGRLAALRPTPDAELDQKLSLAHLQGAFTGLSQTHHQVLVLRELEGLSYAEIGRRLGMTGGAVESTLFRARRRLAEEYEELASGERCRRVQAIVEAAAARRLGARDRRRLAAHVSHCQPCRRAALAAGLDRALLAAPRSLRSKVAALLPIPMLLRRRGGDGDAVPSLGAAHHVAQWSAPLNALADPATSGWLKAVAAAATVTVAGAGVGAATHVAQHAHRARPAPAVSAAQQPSATAVATHGSQAATTSQTTRAATRSGSAGPARKVVSVGDVAQHAGSATGATPRPAGAKAGDGAAGPQGRGLPGHPGRELSGIATALGAGPAATQVRRDALRALRRTLLDGLEHVGVPAAVTEQPTHAVHAAREAVAPVVADAADAVQDGVASVDDVLGGG